MTINTLKFSEMPQSDLADADQVAGLRAGANVLLTENDEANFDPLPYTQVSTLSEQMVANNGYVTFNVGVCVLTLPATFKVGDIIEVCNFSAGGFQIAQNDGQQILFGNVLTTAGVLGSLSSTKMGDSVVLKGMVANTTMMVVGSPQGNLTFV